MSLEPNRREAHPVDHALYRPRGVRIDERDACAAFRYRPTCSLSRQIVVVTVCNHPRPLAIRVGATLRGYDSAGLYGISSAARLAVRELTRMYKLRQVSAWPVAALRAHCSVVRMPDVVRQMQMIARLKPDPRVESVQPFNQFATGAQIESVQLPCCRKTAPPTRREPSA